MYLIYKYKYPLLLKDETFSPFNNQFLHSNILPLQVFPGLLSYGVFSAFFPLIYPFWHCFTMQSHTGADLIIVQPRLLSARVAGRATFTFPSSISDLFSTQPSQKMDCF